MAVNEFALPRQAPGAGLLVSRQPVLDGRDAVVGYRIAYAMLDGALAVEPESGGAFEQLDDLLGVISRDEQALGTMAHLPMPLAVLLEHGLPQLPRHQVLFRIRHEDARQPELRELFARAAAQGVALELDGLAGPGFDPSLLDLFMAVELDVSLWNAEDLPAALAQIAAHDAIALAAGVKDHAARERARELGFEWFTGRFFSTPNLLAGRPVPIGDLNTLIELSRLQRDDAPLEQLIALIERDLGLGVRLLRYINSAYFGLAGRVRSIGYAAAMLGARGLSRWALIVAALGAERIPRELGLLALTRARTCELAGVELGDRLAGDELFTIGLLSTLDAVMGIPLAEIVAELPLTDGVAAALSDHSGPAGEVLGSVISYESGEFLAPAFGRRLPAYASAYRAGLAWAREALGGMQ